MKLYALDGTPSKEKELLTEFQEAREIGALKIGEANLFFRVRLRQYYIPFTDIKRCFRRVYVVPATMCCGKGNLDVENLVIQGEAGELAQIQLPGTKAAKEVIRVLRQKLPEVDFSSPARPKTEEEAART